VVDDDQLLARSARDPEAFGVFYERHERLVLGFFVRRLGDPELAADLAAETFAAALLRSRRFRGAGAPASAWLIGIARNVLSQSVRRSQVENRARRRLGMEPIVLDDELLARVSRLGGDARVASLSWASFRRARPRTPRGSPCSGLGTSIRACARRGWPR
jgi:RNA polymerase sigma-70 factor (ECF subfamily)